MIKQLKFTLLAEGIVENAFIPELLNKLNPAKIKFSKSKLNIKQSANPSKSKVIKYLADFVNTSLIVNEEDLFIVGVDLDEQDLDSKLFKSQEKEILGIIPKKIDKKKVIVFIPVQAFDHWLLYQSYKIKGEKRLVNNSLESKTSEEVKKKLYGSSNPNIYTIQKRTKEILEVLDISDLVKQSKSFAHFHGQVKVFVER